MTFYFQVLVILGWLIAMALGSWSLFSPWHLARRDYVYDAEEATNYAVICPLMWALALCWVIFACHTKNGGLLNKTRFMETINRNIAKLLTLEVGQTPSSILSLILKDNFENGARFVLFFVRGSNKIVVKNLFCISNNFYDNFLGKFCLLNSICVEKSRVISGISKNL